MAVYCLEIRNTDRWDDCRYREYTTSSLKAERFRGVPKIKFTDSAHGLVPTVHEHNGGKRKPNITTLHDYVRTEMRKLEPVKEPASQRTYKAEIEAMQLYASLERMVKAFKPFTLRPIGGEGSDARAEQDEQIAAHAEAMRLLHPALTTKNSRSEP